MPKLEDYIENHARLTPDKKAIVCNGSSISYCELWKKIQSIPSIHSVPSIGGRRAYIWRVTQTIDSLIAYFATHLAGMLAVPLEHDLPDEDFNRIRTLLTNSEPLGSSVPPIRDSKLFLLWQAAKADYTLHSSLFVIRPPYPPIEGGGDILFTTGTTGQSKGVMVSSSAILANAENLVEAHQYTPDLTFIVCGPLNHIGSLSKIWAAVMAGCTIHILPGMKDLPMFFQAVNDAPGKTATFLVPASISILLQVATKQLRDCAHKIDFIETGAAPISQNNMQKLCALLPNARLYNTYASTETGIIATHNYNTSPEDCIAGCLGKTMKHARLAITPDGFISCSGRTIMSGYLPSTHSTSPCPLEGGLGASIITHDKAYLDSQGRLHLTGREDDIINTGGYKVNPTEVEDCAKNFPSVHDCICIPSPHPVLGTALRLLIQTTGNTPLDIKSLARHLSDHLEKHKVPQLYTQVDSIKRTYNGKLNRKHYTEDIGKNIPHTTDKNISG
ncbi:MAG: acyl--CoA ligase [Bacteroidaceae bacterium]|nr:acyl--CoA ligase [Bacteroidaceae bacterium]